MREMFATRKENTAGKKFYLGGKSSMQIERKAFLCFYPICVYFIHLFVNFLLARYIVHTNGEFLFLRIHRGVLLLSLTPAYPREFT